MNAALLFSRSESGALLKGTRIHEALSRIAWLEPPFRQPDEIDPADVDLASASDLRDALTRPAELADLWRERSFEVILDGRWVSGTFDRVAFTGSGAELRAEIMDFKTNRMHAGESTDEFRKRMTDTYAPQMELYRQALQQLTGMASGRIIAALLLTATQECVHV